MNVTLDPLMLWLFPSRSVDHCSSVVHTCDFGIWPAFCKNLGAIAWPTSQIGNSPHTFDEYSRGEIVARPCSLFREFEVLIGNPTQHCPLCSHGFPWLEKSEL
jgi:hypothetical protein